MNKILHPFDQKLDGSIYYPVFIKIEIENGKLSITGTQGPKPNGDAYGSSGQIDMEYWHYNSRENDYRYKEPTKPTELQFTAEWSQGMWLELLHIWKRWHLNDLQAGCKHQRELGWDEELVDPTKPASQDNMKMWKYPPIGHLTEPCPVCGYKFGTAWLKEELPQSVIDFLESLPVTDRTPAWV